MLLCQSWKKYRANVGRTLASVAMIRWTWVDKMMNQQGSHWQGQRGSRTRENWLDGVGNIPFGLVPGKRNPFLSSRRQAEKVNSVISYAWADFTQSRRNWEIKQRFNFMADQ